MEPEIAQSAEEYYTEKRDRVPIKELFKKRLPKELAADGEHVTPTALAKYLHEITTLADEIINLRNESNSVAGNANNFVKLVNKIEPMGNYGNRSDVLHGIVEGIVEEYRGIISDEIVKRTKTKLDELEKSLYDLTGLYIEGDKKPKKAKKSYSFDNEIDELADSPF